MISQNRILSGEVHRDAMGDGLQGGQDMSGGGGGFTETTEINGTFAGVRRALSAIWVRLAALRG